MNFYASWLQNRRWIPVRTLQLQPPLFPRSPLPHLLWYQRLCNRLRFRHQQSHTLLTKYKIHLWLSNNNNNSLNHSHYSRNCRRNHKCSLNHNRNRNRNPLHNSQWAWYPSRLRPQPPLLFLHSNMGNKSPRSLNSSNIIHNLTTLRSSRIRSTLRTLLRSNIQHKVLFLQLFFPQNSYFIRRLFFCFLGIPPYQGAPQSYYPPPARPPFPQQYAQRPAYQQQLTVHFDFTFNDILYTSIFVGYGHSNLNCWLKIKHLQPYGQPGRPSGFPPGATSAPPQAYGYPQGYPQQAAQVLSSIYNLFSKQSSATYAEEVVLPRKKKIWTPRLWLQIFG